MLTGKQKKYLRGLAHGMKPVVQIGWKGLSASLIRALEEALDTHELIKVKFIDFKEKDRKEALIEEIVRRTGADLTGVIGNTAQFYREHPDPEKRGITLPQ